MQDLNKQVFQDSKNLNSNNWTKVNFPENSINQEYDLHNLPRTPNKINTSNKFNSIGINRVGNFINISNVDIFVKANLLDCIMSWVMR